VWLAQQPELLGRLLVGWLLAWQGPGLRLVPKLLLGLR
jgi:hypothetical protein